MKTFKSILLLVSIAALLVISTPLEVHAEGLSTFTKYAGNPLPFHPSYPGRIETGTYQPSVLYENGIFKLWYASLAADGFKLAYAESPDGINWGNYSLLPVTDTAASHNPSILHINNMYELYYTSDNGGLIVTKVSDNTSTRTVMVPEEPWESRGIFAPHVTERNGNYTMFYTGWGNQGFGIGMASSTEGDNWHKCENNPVLPFTADGAFLFKKNDISYLFFHSENGIEYISTPGDPRCDSVWERRTIALSRGPGEYDVSHMISPSLVEKGDNIYLYYSGLGAAGWTLNLASTIVPSQQIPPPPLKEPVVIIPGLFASWNKEAILHDTEVNDNQWTITPFVKEYDGIMKTLEQIGYVRDKDYYVYTYDWRKPIATIADRFNEFMTAKVLADHPNEKIHLIAHSLGGLVGRTYLQKYQPHLNATLVTVGTPHLGAAPAYKAVEAGDIETQNTYEWLAEKLILQLHRGTSLTDREILQRFMPVINDLLPVYPYLKKLNGANILPSTTIVSNEFLRNLNMTTLLQIKQLGSDTYSTLTGYTVTPRTALDKILDIYPDGRPVASYTEPGDGLVAIQSSVPDSSLPVLSGNHGDIIAKKDQLKSIFELSGLSIDDADVKEGAASTVFPALIGLILSPAKLTIMAGSTMYNEENGVIFIPQASANRYTVIATGIDSGNYTILLGALNGDITAWRTIYGSTSPGKIDSYFYDYDPVFPWKGTFGSGATSNQYSELIKTINVWLGRHNRKILPSLYKNHRDLIHYLIHDQKPSQVVEILPLIEQIEEIIPTRKIPGFTCDTEIQRTKKEYIKAENSVLRSNKSQKERALILLWLKKRMMIIDTISTKIPEVAEIMTHSNEEIIDTIR
jgi:pimeloyl-ACP methyl ester carboxylesterase